MGNASPSEQSALEFVLEFLFFLHFPNWVIFSSRLPATREFNGYTLHASPSTRPSSYQLSAALNFTSFFSPWAGPYSIQLTLGSHLSRCQGSTTKLYGYRSVSIRKRPHEVKQFYPQSNVQESIPAFPRFCYK